MLVRKTCDSIVLVSRRMGNSMSDKEEKEEENDEDNEEEEDDESSGEDIADSEDKNNDEEGSESGEDSDASESSDPFIDNKSRYVICGVEGCTRDSYHVSVQKGKVVGKGKIVT